MMRKFLAIASVAGTMGILTNAQAVATVTVYDGLTTQVFPDTDGDGFLTFSGSIGVWSFSSTLLNQRTQLEVPQIPGSDVLFDEHRRGNANDKVVR